MLWNSRSRWKFERHGAGIGYQIDGLIPVTCGCQLMAHCSRSTTATNVYVIKRSTFHIVNQPRRPQFGCAQRHQATQRVTRLGRG